MEFWWLFFMTSCSMMWFIYYLPAKYNIFTIRISVTLLIFISGLRYYIGTDYPTYVMFFNEYSAGAIFAAMNDGLEPAISIIISFLGLLGGTFQLMFLLYSFIIIGGYYYGCRIFIGNNCYILILSVLLYVTYNSTGGFWWGMNAIRQAAAMSIALISAKYLISDENVKFIFGIFIAAMFHYSALVFLPALYLRKVHVERRTALWLVAISVVLTISGLSKNIVLNILAFSLGIIGKYESALALISSGDKSFSYMSLVYVAMYLFSLYECKNNDRSYFKIIYNLSIVFIIIRVLTSFSLGGPSIQYILHRFEVYYLPFFLIYSAYGLYIFASKIKPFWMGWATVTLFIIMLSYLSIINIAKIGGDTSYPLPSQYPGENIDYDANFNLIE